MLTVAGAGMAGLVAAARARELGVDAVVLEKGDRPGGSMLLSSGVVWRYRSLELFREQCPGGDAALQRAVVERLDDALGWLERLGAPVVWRETRNPLTTGMRFQPRGLTDALLRAAGDVRLRTRIGPDGDRPLVLATGGFQGDRRLVERYVTREPLLLRANRWSTGDGLALALASGSGLTSGMSEFYGRNMPAGAAIGEGDFVRAAQLYGRHARVVNDEGAPFAPADVSWSEIDLVQATARQPGARAWYVVDAGALDRKVGERSVREMVDAARAVGGDVVSGAALAAKLGVPVQPRSLAVHVHAAITHTIGGVRIDDRARVLRDDGTPVERLYAAGADAGGISTGGYASGLASALVFGLIAAETARSDL